MSNYSPKLLDYTSTELLAKDVEDELYSIQTAIEVAESNLVVTDTAVAPSKPQKHQLVNAVSPWNPGQGFGYYVYDGSTWVKLVPFQDAPSDGNRYVRQNGAWVVV